MAKTVINYKRTIILLTKEMNEKGMSSGSLIKSIGRHAALVLNVVINKDNEIISYSEKTYNFVTIQHDNCLVFLDIVYDSRSCRHYFRFLFGDKVIGITYKKGKTIAMLQKEFEILHHGTHFKTKEKK